jgi:hypothetical protein
MTTTEVPRAEKSLVKDVAFVWVTQPQYKADIHRVWLDHLSTWKSISVIIMLHVLGSMVRKSWKIDHTPKEIVEDLRVWCERNKKL